MTRSNVADALTQRTQRAYEALADGLWRIEVASEAQWTIHNGGGKSYTITNNGDAWTCTCPDRPPRSVACKHIIGIQLVLQQWAAQDELSLESAVRTFRNGGYDMTYADGLKTLTGLTLSELAELLDRELPSEAYKPINYGAGKEANLTDIDPNWMRKVLTEAFGLCGIGWGYEYSAENIEVLHGDKQKYAVIKRLEFWYALVSKDVIDKRCTIPATGGSGNTEVQYALKGALTNAIGNAVSNIGFQLSVYLGKRDHKTVNGHKPAPSKNGAAKKPAATKAASNGEKPHSDPAEYIIPAGKHKGKRLGDVSDEVLLWYVNALKPSNDETQTLKTQATALFEQRQMQVEAV